MTKEEKVNYKLVQLEGKISSYLEGNEVDVIEIMCDATIFNIDYSWLVPDYVKDVFAKCFQYMTTDNSEYEPDELIRELSCVLKEFLGKN